MKNREKSIDLNNIYINNDNHLEKKLKVLNKTKF